MSNLMDMPKVSFGSLKDVKNFVSMTKTDTANYFYKLVKDSIKIIGKEQDVYYYDSNKKLWCCVTKEVYVNAIADYFNDISKALYKSFKKFSVMDEDDENDEDDEMIKKLKKQVQDKQKDLDSSAYINVIIERSTGKLQDNAFTTKLNSDHNFLPVKNGKKISLVNGKLFNRTKTDLFTFECDVEKVEETPKADKFFSQVMPNKEEREYLRSVLGYLITGNMDARCFFIFYGDGSNGKTVIMNLLKTILKKLYHQTAKGIFMKGSQEKTEGASPDKIALIGVRCAVYSEGETSDDIDINESLLKMISGKDEINARPLFRAPLTFYPICKLCLLTNYKPDLNGDKSIRQRIRYLFFNSSFVDEPDPKKPNEFKRDDDFIDLLQTKYLSEIFSWILKGSIKYYKDKQIIPPKSFQDKTDSFFEQQDSITSFVNHKLTITNNDKNYIKKSAIFEIYKTFCNDNSQRCHPRSTLFKRLEDLQLRISTLDGYAVYRGVEIKQLADSISDDDYDNGIEKNEKGVDLTLECVSQINTLKNEIIEIKKKVNKMPPIIDDEFIELKKNKNQDDFIQLSDNTFLDAKTNTTYELANDSEIEFDGNLF